MNKRGRLSLFFIGAAGIALLWAAALIHLPGPVDLRDRYIRAITSRTFSERNITNAVSGVNFDFRAIDTVGEEFILFASIMGSLVLLREADEKKTRQLIDAVSKERDVGPSDAVRLWILAMFAPKVAFGIYIITHSQLTPGGGFQGGVVLASAAMIIYLGSGFLTFKRIMIHRVIEIAEAVGAAGFLFIGAIAYFHGKPFLTNVVPLGKAHELTSGGMIPLISATIGIEVAAGFVLLIYAFLQANLTTEEEK